MGRPKKTVADWIPLDVNDGKTFYVLFDKWGNDGFTFWVQLLRLLGRSEGLYFRIDETSQDYFFASVKVDENIGFDIINTLVKMGNIDRELWEKERVIWCEGLADRLELLFEKTNRGAPTKPVINGGFIGQNLATEEFYQTKPEKTPSKEEFYQTKPEKTPSKEEFYQTKPEKLHKKSELCPEKVHNNITEHNKNNITQENKNNAHDARAADEPPLVDFLGGELSPPKKDKLIKHKHGEYGRVLLTEEEFIRLKERYGESELTAMIDYVDGVAERTDNKAGYKRWAAVINQYAKSGWHKRPAPAQYGGNTNYREAQRQLENVRDAEVNAARYDKKIVNLKGKSNEEQ